MQIILCLNNGRCDHPEISDKSKSVGKLSGILVFEHNVGVHQLGEVYVSKLNLEVAKKLIESAEAEAKSLGVSMVITLSIS